MYETVPVMVTITFHIPAACYTNCQATVIIMWAPISLYEAESFTRSALHGRVVILVIDAGNSKQVKRP